MGARSFMRCFCTKSKIPTSTSSKEIDAFYYFLLKDLGQLDQSSYEGSVSLQFLADAMNILRKIQVEQLDLFKKSTYIVSTEAKDIWFDQYMQDSLAMLDFCNSLKLALWRLNRYCMMVDIIIQKLRNNYDSNSAVSSKKLLLEKIKSEHQKFVCVRLGCKVDVEGKGIATVMAAAKTTMAVVSLLLFSAIVSPISIEFDGSGTLPCKGRKMKKPLAEELSALVRRLNERILEASKGSGLVIVEEERVGRVMEDVRVQMMKGVDNWESFWKSVELLRWSLIGLKEGVKKLGEGVDEVFDVVIRGRKDMLGVIMG